MVTALDTQTALVLVDFQRFILQVPLLAPASELLAHAGQLLAAFRHAGLPVVLVATDPSRATGPVLRSDANRSRHAFTPEQLALVAEMTPVPGDILITKHTWGAFYDTDLDAELRRRRVTGLVLAGVATSMGVESTARAAHERGYNLTFAQDAMTDLVASAQENSLQNIFPRLGEVDSTANILKLFAAR